ncbi:FRIGIDA-like protein 3 [Pyrus x bretschneideri]|uniref:FRIGIDA-like protein 3 n=1 Tax=Pyrus x bretschneideri TaxID=225117 RepID=UPI000511A726|nr:FRIGIDA-like protein 3 [Pyrus x bretschneideri]XP_018499803.1 FRIGIDA-like protein 3 [Pyrus x bretschneideri]XP_048430022.1 FRIGIDA-like protein 3 [Pyrus x bretschneideri]
MDNTHSVSTLIDCTTSKIQQLQKAFSELESHRAVTLNLKWKELEAHFHGLEKSLKRRFDELESQEKEFETRTIEAQKLLEKRQAAVVAKEQASLEILQKKRDAAAYAITHAREKQRKVSTEEPSVVTDDGQGEPPSVEEKPPDMIVSDSNCQEMKSPEMVSIEVMSYPQLAKLCEQMDTEGLHTFISDNRKNLASIREEIPLALRAAAKPALFVLESLEDFYRLEGPNTDRKKDANLLGVRRTCIMLMECLSTLLTNPELVSASDIITEEVKDMAEAIAEEWKPKLDALDMDASNGNSLEAHAFLQLLGTFGISSGFDEEELFRIIPMVSRRRQAADLCRSLGLTERMPGVIEVLVNSGRQIDAVNLAFAFELTEKFSPVPLLKSYLKEARKTSPVKSGNASPTAQNEVNDRELAALKAVLKSIEEHKLEEQYPVDPLQKRVLQLEKAKADKKRVAEAAKPQPKRPRANGVGYAPRVTNVVTDKTFYPRVADNRYPQYVYDRQFVYPGPADNHCPSLLGSATYNMSPAHGNYYATGYQYQPAAYLH